MIPNDVFMKLGHIAQRAAHRIRVRSALNPMLWLTLVVMPTCLYAAYLFQSNTKVCYILIGAAIVPMIITCLGFLGFAIFKPEKLQSEDYQIRHETLQLIQGKTGGPIPLDSTSLEAIANPIQQLPSGEGDGEC